MITVLKVLFSILLVWVTYTVISTSIKSNLFEQWDYLGSIPWMKATLWDFYTNATAIFLWICYKQKGIVMKIVWLILLITLGSIATCTFVLIQLFKLKQGEGLREFFVNQNA